MYKKLKLKKGQYEMWKEEDDDDDEEIKALEQYISHRIEKEKKRDTINDNSLKQPLNSERQEEITEAIPPEGT